MDVNSADHALQMIRRYTRAVSDGRVNDVAALFAENAELRDPFDGQAQHGREAIRAFFEGTGELVDSLAVDGEVRITRDARTAAAPMHADVVLEGTSLEMDAIDVFFFDDNGLFSAMHAFYGPTNFRPKGSRK